MQLFSDLDLDSAPEDLNVPDGNYLAEVVNVDLRPYDVQDPDHVGTVGHKLVCRYEILEGPWAEMLVFSRGQFANPWDGPMRKVHLKRWLRSHGIPERQDLQALDSDDLIGLQVHASVRRGRVFWVRPLNGYAGE